MAAPVVELNGFRRVQLRYGETLQQLSARELGDAAAWVQIAALNNLMPPYVTGDADRAGRRVALYGDTLMIPAPSRDIEPGYTIAEDVLKQDVALTRGVLTEVGGDFGIVAGHENLKQALIHRVATEPGELIFHLEYGCDVHKLKGDKNNPVSALRGAKYVERAVLSDPRIDRVGRATAEVNGDEVRVEVSGQTVTGHPVDIIEGV